MNTIALAPYKRAMGAQAKQKPQWLVKDRGNVICLTCAMCVERCECPRFKEHHLRRMVEPSWVYPSIFDHLIRAIAVVLYVLILFWVATR